MDDNIHISGRRATKVIQTGNESDLEMLRELKAMYDSEFAIFFGLLKITNTKVQPLLVRNNRFFIVHISMIPQLRGQANTEEQVKAYYELIEKGMNRGNLFVVGQEGVGKTSVVKNIMKEAWRVRQRKRMFSKQSNRIQKI